MLWDIIRDFIVQHITGGCDSSEVYYNPYVGVFLERNGTGTLENEFLGAGTDIYYKVGTSYNNNALSLSLSDWLATTITAVIMCLLVVFAVWLVRWIFKAVSSAFLLK